MKNSKIQDIITKSILEEASSEEIVMLENWRRESSQNESLYKEYTTLWEASANYESIDFQPKAESAYEKHLELLTKEKSNIVDFVSRSTEQITTPKSRTKFFSIRRVASLAAIFVMAFGAMFVFNTMSKTSISADNGVLFTSLSDGSSIWLDEGSTVTYSNGFGTSHRDLTLEGKAFFDVQRNENLAFNIKSNDIDVSVLGTSFTVDTKKGNNIVAVKSGKVSVKAADKEVTLLANEKVTFENNTFNQEVVASEDIAWRNDKLSFNNAPLDQVIADINLFHDDKIVVENDMKNMDCPFTARSLSNTSFDNIIEILKITYDLEIENQANGKVSLTISDCK